MQNQNIETPLAPIEDAPTLTPTLAEVERDVEAMIANSPVDALTVAVCKLARLAFGVQGSEESCDNPFRDSQIEDVAGHLAALRVGKLALSELERMCLGDIEEKRAWLREELERLQEVAPEAV
jgi:hypothetical protein